jgi:hypothetical protein
MLTGRLWPPTWSAARLISRWRGARLTAKPSASTGQLFPASASASSGGMARPKMKPWM